MELPAFIFHDIALFIFILSVNGLVIFGLISILRFLDVSREKRISLGFFAFAAVAGFLIIWDGPQEGIIYYFNLPIIFLADELNWLSIKYLGDISFWQPDYTIPWFLRQPQIYLMVSIIFWTLIGHIIQLKVNERRKTYLNKN